MRIFWNWLLPCIFLSVSYSCFAQGLPYKRYTAKEGLSNSRVYRICRDNRGMLWMTTNNGLSCFDGYSFTNYPSEQFNGQALSVTAGADGVVWVAGSGGLYSIKNGVLSRYTVKNKLLSEIPVHIRVDTGGRKWIVNNVNQAGYVLGDSFYHFEIKNDKREKVAINNIFTAKAGTVFFTTSDGVYQLDATGKPVVYRQDWVHIPFYAFAEDNKGHFYFGTTGKIYILDNGVTNVVVLPSEVAVQNIAAITPGNVFASTSSPGFFRITGNGIVNIAGRIGAEDVFVNDMYNDEKGGLFIATYGKGLYILKDLNVTGYSAISGLNNSAITCVKEAPGGELYIGGFGGISIYDGTGFKPLEKILLQQNEKVNDILFDGYNAWIATPYHIFRYELVTKQVYRTGLDALKLQKGRDGYIYAGSYRELFRFAPDAKFNKVEPPYESPVCNNRVYDMLMDDSAEHWYATDIGVVREKDKQLSRYTFRNPVTDIIHAFARDSADNIWMATQAGLIELDNRRQWHKYTVKDGLPDNYCICLYYSNGMLWIGTSRGLAGFDGKKFQSYEYEAGLPVEEIYSIHGDRNNNLWLGTGIGLFKWELQKHVGLSQPPAVVIKNIVTGNRKSSHGMLTLPYAGNTISFEYVSPEYFAPELVSYEYRLTGLDSNWYETSNRSVRFSSLGPGEYRFEIRAKFKGIEKPSEPASVPFVILTPFYLEWWFVLACLLLLAGMLALLVNRRIKIIKRIEKQRSVRYTRLLRLKQRAMNALISPHFIFNSLNSIQHFINESDKLSANKYLSKFAKLIRTTMDNSTRLYVRLADELSMLELYLSLETIRLPGKLTYSIEVDNTIDKQKLSVPSMLIQPYVENAIWHGISPKRSPGYVLIAIRQLNKSFLEVTVKDNGVGYDQYKLSGNTDDTHKSLGLKLNRQRLVVIEQLTGHKLEFSMKPVYDDDGWIAGTCVVFTLPIKMLQ